VINNATYTLSDKGTLYINSGWSGRLLQSIKIGFGSQSSVGGAPSTGLGYGNGLLLVPSGSKLVAFGP
jgi:hypothetical protein